MIRPLIGITTARVLNNAHIHVMSVAEAYVQAVYQAGGLPLLIPLGIADTDLAPLLVRLHGLLLYWRRGYRPRPLRWAAAPQGL